MLIFKQSNLVESLTYIVCVEEAFLISVHMHSSCGVCIHMPTELLGCTYATLTDYVRTAVWVFVCGWGTLLKVPVGSSVKNINPMYIFSKVCANVAPWDTFWHLHAWFKRALHPTIVMSDRFFKISCCVATNWTISVFSLSDFQWVKVWVNVLEESLTRSVSVHLWCSRRCFWRPTSLRLLTEIWFCGLKALQTSAAFSVRCSCQRLIKEPSLWSIGMVDLRVYLE